MEFTYIIDDGIEKTCFVPLYNGQSTLEINSLWFFHIFDDGRMIYAPFKRNDASIAGHQQCFVFDILSYLVFGENNASGVVLGEQSPLSRSHLITMYECTPVKVFNGTTGDFMYEYEYCLYKHYWAGETFKWISANPGSSSGGATVVGGGGGGSNNGGNGGSNSSASGRAQLIFENENLQNDSWKVLNLMLDSIIVECMGENLFNQIKDKLNGQKVTFQYVNGKESSYNDKTNTLKIGVDNPAIDVLFHEMIHLFQSLLNRDEYTLDMEIEAHYSQYQYIKSKKLEKDFKRDQRWDAITSLNTLFDKKGILYEFYDKDYLNYYLSEIVDPCIRKIEGYSNYTANRNIDNTGLLLTFNSIIKDCY